MKNGTVDAHADVALEAVAEQRLWTAVIVHAVRDWLSGTLRDQREAQRFLFEDNDNFNHVCSCAGLDPSSFRSKLLRVGRRVEAHGTLAHPLAA
jgi:hypothetical protein